jgi:hypothetical protein
MAALAAAAAAAVPQTAVQQLCLIISPQVGLVLPLTQGFALQCIVLCMPISVAHLADTSLIAEKLIFFGFGIRLKIMFSGGHSASGRWPK